MTSLAETRASISLSIPTLAILFLSEIVTPAVAQEQDPMVLYDANGTTVRTHLQFGLNAVAEQNLFWELAAVTAPSAGFDPDTEWLEVYVKPGLSFERRLDAGAILYGEFSAVASYTWGTDAFDTGDEGRYDVRGVLPRPARRVYPTTYCLARAS